MVIIRWFVATILAFVGVFNIVAAQEITSDSYFYGQSPPVYPSREFHFFIPVLWRTDNGYGIAKGSGTGGWNVAYARAKALVARMTLEEKVRPQVSFTLLELGLRINRVT